MDELFIKRLVKCVKIHKVHFDFMTTLNHQSLKMYIIGVKLNLKH